jgi:predicted permease
MRLPFSKRRQELTEEIQSHLQMAADDRMGRGEPAEEAQAAAHREFGNAAVVREVTHDQWGWSWLEDLLQDVRFGLRMLCKSPGFTAVAVLTLALGIGANTAIFSVVDAVLLSPLPFPVPSRLVSVQDFDTIHGLPHPVASYPDFFDWRSRNRVFSSMTAFHDNDYTLKGAEQAAHLSGEVVTSDFLTTLGIPPELGRGFMPQDEKPGHHVVVLSNRLWRMKFGADPKIIGRIIELNDQNYSVVGVMPPGFSFPIGFPPIELWTPSSDDAGGPRPATAARDSRFLHVMARLKSGVTIAEAKADITNINSNLSRQYPNDDLPFTGAYLQPELQHLVGGVAPPLLVLFGAVGFVLLISCANVAGLLLARAMTRQREMAVRAALGASRQRIVRQALTESVMLANLGGALGLALTLWGIAGLSRLVPQGIPRFSQIQINSSVLLFALLTSLATSILFGLAPALQSSKADLIESLKDGGRGLSQSKGRSRLRGILVVGEVALALLLLTGAGLMVRSFAQLETLNPGFDPDHLLTFNFDLPYSTPNKLAFYDELLRRLNALPGVDSAAGTFPLPMSGNSVSPSFSIQGRPAKKGNEPHANIWVVTPNFFNVMKIPLVRGREFSQTDGPNSVKVVIINQAFARRYFPSENPVGKFIVPTMPEGNRESGPQAREIVGIVGDVRTHLSEPASPQYYLPFSQMIMAPPLTAVVRTAAAPDSLTSAARGTLKSLDPDVPIYNVETMDQYVAGWSAPQGIVAALLSAFAGLALALTALALYGVISYDVTLRTHEIGLRMALGAHPRDVLSMVIREGLLLAGAGIVFGLGGTLALTRFLQSLLFGIKATDPATFASVAILLWSIALLACYIPARRAMRVDPMVALRYE